MSAAPRLDPAVKKSYRLTVLFTEGEKVRLERVAAYYAKSKSEAAHDIIVAGMVDLAEVGNDALADGEKKQDDWRTALGLRS
jgi:hypothetical protein